jgi:hypothetical protein
LGQVNAEQFVQPFPREGFAMAAAVRFGRRRQIGRVALFLGLSESLKEIFM